ncbi:hypothetical protein CDL12_18552 [Handroanthus impetiginosus]|uniref:Uncharacterized protein n=1 Tax=Handroanthus impetiginosus TaxID=429701 RepID=A0A2G9GUC7_9LAMI|nr:hypothetical protein CDL12_18552 [Handroanthus impetiginosus]
MDLRSCGTKHYIKTIRNGSVIKVCNINSRGRPVIRSKTLKDVYENDDAKRLSRPPSGLVFDYEQVKCENPSFLVADRTLREIKPKTSEFIPCADDDAGSDLDDATTLKQLKRRISTKKRKCIQSDENSKQDTANEKQLEDDTDLHEPLINWKSKRSKTSKAKRKHVNLGVSSSIIKHEENLVAEGSLQVGGELIPTIRVKVEVQEDKQLECQNKISSPDESSIGHDEGLNSGGKALDEFQKMVMHEYGEPSLCAHKHQSSVTNQILHDNLEDVEPISMLVPTHGISVKLETPEQGCEEFLDLPLLATEDGEEIRDAHSCRRSLSENPNSDVSIHCRDSSSMKEISEQSSTGIQVPDMASNSIVGCMRLDQEFNSVPFEDEPKADFPYDQVDSVSSPDKNNGSYSDSVISPKTDKNLVSLDDNIADEEQSSAYSFDAITKNGLCGEGHIEDELLKVEEYQTSASSITDGESWSSLKNQTCDCADTISTQEPRQPPGRLLSTRKAISPSSQERLCLALSSVELSDDTDQYKCNEKLFEKQTRKKCSRRKVSINPRRVINKSQVAKGNIESSRFSRTLPNLSSGCMSIQGCSESAIAFSQRQMHDMESLAVKLMEELKTMKDIVEQKLLFEAYRNVSLKNDADEVKSAINNATKVEETAKKWLSMMARDCNRFCRIMEMTPNSTTSSRDAVPRQRKKIIFADEAGGKLCHIRFFEDGVTSPVSDAVRK